MGAHAPIKKQQRWVNNKLMDKIMNEINEKIIIAQLFLIAHDKPVSLCLGFE